MKKKQITDSFTASNGITIELALQESALAPELTASDFEHARLVNDPAMIDAWQELKVARKRGRPKKERPKVNTTIRLDADVLDKLQATGKGWMIRANTAIAEWLSKHSPNIP